MPELEYNLGTGIDQNSLLNLRIDTQERLSYLNNLKLPDYQPLPSFIPKHLSPDDIIQGNPKLPSIDDALASDDATIRNAAKQQVYAKMSKDPKSIGWGVGRSLPYQEGQNKFTDDHWYKEKQYTMYGFDPYKSIAENEDWIHKQTWDNYSLPGQIWRGVGTFAGRTLSKLVTGLVGTVGDIGAIAWNGLQELGDATGITDGKNNFWADVSNNWLSRKMTDLDQHVKDEWLPTYQALDYNNKGAWNKLFDPYTWQTSFADGAGFLLQFAVPGSIFGKAAQAGKIARGIGEFSTIAELEASGAQGMLAAEKLAKTGMTIEEAKNVSGFSKFMGLEISDATRFGKIAGRVTEGLTGSKDMGGITAHLFNTSMEAVSETKSGFDDTVQNLRQKGMSEQEAIKIASENAPTQFWLNMGILSASNAFENKLLQKAIGNRVDGLKLKLNEAGEVIEPNPTTWFGKAIEKTFGEGNKLGNRIKFYGKLGLESAWWEGYWEENAQTAAQRSAAGQYTRYGDDTDNNGKQEQSKGFWSQYIKQTVDSANGNDREAADSIMAGVVIGVLGGTVFAKMSGERKEEIHEKAKIIADYKNNRDAWLSLGILSEDIFDQHGKVNMEKAKVRASEINQKLDKMASVFKKTITAEQLVNPEERESLQHEAFADYVKAHILNGTVDQLIKRLSNWGEKNPGELALYGVTQEMQRDAPHWAALATDLKNVYEKADSLKYAAAKSELAIAPKGDETTQTYFAKAAAVKSLVYDYTALKGMADKLVLHYQDLKNKNNPFSAFPMQQAYNEKQAEIMTLQALINGEQTPVVKEKLTKKLEILQKDQDKRKEDILANGDSKLDGTGFMFPKDIKDLDKVVSIDDINDYMENQLHQSAKERDSDTYNDLIKDYSDPRKGILKWNQTIEFWSAKKQEADNTIQQKADNEAFKASMDDLTKQRTAAEDELNTASTEEDKQTAQGKIDEIDKKINDLKQTTNKDETDLQDITDDQKDDDQTLDDINNDITTPPPTGSDFGIRPNHYDSERLAWFTSFKTANSETGDAETENGEKILWKENVLEHSYDHDLTQFIYKYMNEMSQNSDKYEAFVIADTQEMLESRLSKSQLDAFIAGKKELGAIVVFKEKGKDGWVKFENRNKQPLVAFSYNELSFEDRKTQRADIKAKKEGISQKEALEMFAKQQAMADGIRAMVLADKSLQVPIQAGREEQWGSGGVFPVTYQPGSAIERFNGFYDSNDIFDAVKDVNQYPAYLALQAGDVVLKIPKEKTDTGLPFYIPVRGGTLASGKVPLNIRVYQSVEGIFHNKFDTIEEAQAVVQNFLKKLFYVDTKQYFKIKEEKSKFKIVNYVKDKDDKEIASKSFSSLRLKLFLPLYREVDAFTIYEKDKITNKFVPIQLSHEDYKSFIHNSLETTRKLLTVNRNGSEKVWTHKVNAYLNLDSKVEGIDARGNITKSTEDVATPKEATPTIIDEKKADIEQRRQAELFKFYEGKNKNNFTEQVFLSNEEGRKELVNIIKYLAEGNTKKSTATKFNSKESDIQKIRDYFEIPSRTLGSTLSGQVGTEEEVKEAEEKFKQWKNNIDKINAKYDAELKALEQSAPKEEAVAKGLPDILNQINKLHGINMLFFNPSKQTGREAIDYLNSDMQRFYKRNVTAEDLYDARNFFAKDSAFNNWLERAYGHLTGKNFAGDTIQQEDTGDPIVDLATKITQKETELREYKAGMAINIKNAITPQLAKILGEQLNKKITEMEKELKELRAIMPKDEGEKPPTPKEELRAETALSQPLPEVNPIIILKVGRNEVQFDFDQGKILTAIKMDANKAEKLKEILEKAHAFTIKEIKINENNVYLVKYNKLGKFVITNDLFEIISLTPEIQENEEYKKLKDCE